MSAAEALGLPPGVRFDPTGDELVEFYLLPRALGRKPAVPGIIIEDDAAAATSTSTSAQHPWKLLKRRRRTEDNEAYFFERVDAGSKGSDSARHQDRSCGGGSWTWVGQKRAPDEVLPVRGNGGGEQVSCSWGKYSLNLHEGRRKGGSTGWVMHEYTVASPECPLLPVKLCHVSFTGHGQKRQRVPDDDDGEEEGRELEVEPQAAASGSSSMVTTATAEIQNQELSEACCAQNQELGFLNYDYCNSSCVGDFSSSDAGFSQESSIILDPSYPGEPFALAQQLAQNHEFPATHSQAYHQEQFVNPAGSSIEAHCAALLASDLATEEEFSVSQLLGVISSPRCPPTTTTPADYHEQQQQQQQHIQSFAPAATAGLPLSTDQLSCTTQQSHGIMGQNYDFFSGWGDIESFCDTTGIPDDDAMAALQTLVADVCRGGTSWDDGHFFYEQPAL